MIDTQLIIAILLTIAPIVELRGGLPVAVQYALSHEYSVMPIFFLILILNILVIFPILFFLDFFHHKLLRFKPYKNCSDIYLKRIQKKAEKVEKKMGNWGYFALALFVGVPLPGTGAWTGSIILWFLNLERKKAIPAVALGVCIAGIAILIGSLGFFKIF